MAGRTRLSTVLMLLTAIYRTTDATPSWKIPMMTGETDKYIKSFDESITGITVYEDIPVGHKLGTLQIDAQPGDTVAVTQADTNTALLQLDFNQTTNTEVNVWTKSGLDYEQNQDEIILSVSLNGGQTLFIIIKPLDVNDNPPEFVGTGSQVNLFVPENQLNDSLLILKATDDDVGATATLTYTLDTEYSEIFKLLPVSGNPPACQLQLVEELDYEARQLYRLTITAKDAPDDRGKTQETSVAVFVNVEDDSDTAPRWLVAPVVTSKDEGLPKGGELFTVEAIDGDTNVNNPIAYSIVSQNPEGIAEIDTTTGKVTVTKALDREDEDIIDGYITIDVQAKEVPASAPDQPCTSITCVSGTALITVNDIDDNSPVFDNPSYAIQVPENTSGAIMFITVTDRDVMPPNNLVRLSLDGAPEGVFGFNSDREPTPLSTYILVLNKDYMDYENEDHRIIKFKVVAMGDNEAERTTSSDITITLTDVDESGGHSSWKNPWMSGRPDHYIKEFDVTNSVITLYEDIPVGHKLGTLRICKAPEEQFAVSQQDPDTAKLLLAFNGTGEDRDVFITTGLDYEMYHEQFSIVVLLNGRLANNIIINVAGVNENPPIFDGNIGPQIYMEIPENQINDSLLILSATDEDEGATATLTYSLDTENPELFSLQQLPGSTPACQLQLVKPLDYETKQLHRLAISVMDAPDGRGKTFTASVTVFIDVLDVNDTAQQQLEPTVTTSRDEGAIQGEEQLTVKTTDGDTVVNNPVSFSFVSQEPEDMTEVDKATGKMIAEESRRRG